MVRKKIVVTLLLTLGVATGAEAQGIGSRIKQKVASASQASPAVPASPAAQSGSKLGFPLTDDVMKSFESGLQIEIRIRQAYTSSLAGLKTQDEYLLCEGQVQAGPVGMAIQEEFINRVDKINDEADLSKLTTWMTDTMNVEVTKACGANPQPRYDAQADEFKKAREAGAVEFGTALPGSLAADILRWYGIVQEWAVPFYQLSVQAQEDAAKNGLSIPGSGTNIFWVYTAAEATLLLAHKTTLEPLLKALI